MNDSFSTDPSRVQNGPTDHGTFVGTCTNCGIVWEFENYEVIPVPGKEAYLIGFC